MSRTSADTRRFNFLKGALLLAGLLLVGRVVQLQVFQHDTLKKAADNQWTSTVPLNAERGNIYDRNNQALALSVTTWRVGLATSLIDDKSELLATLSQILNISEKSLQQKVRQAKGRHIVLGSDVVLSSENKKLLLRQKAVTTENLNSRIYPRDGVGAALVGFYRHGKEGDIATGLELGLDDYLAGTAGRAQEIETAVPGHNLGAIELEKATHGQSLVLSLDVELQRICEQQLAASVAECGADGGAVLILDPNTGDVLSAASWPLLPTREGRHSEPAVWNNRNFTGQYEPGSVFKIFSTASLLQNSAIDTATVFNCTDGNFGKFTIRNSDGHSYGDLPLLPAFSRSSNIYFARAVGNLSKRELYHDLVQYGFGQGTTIPYPGQVDGILNSPEKWSGRSKPTIAIGQEVAVTPLQLGLAVCAVANGGTLYAPRLVTRVVDDQGNLISEKPPVPLRRIMAEPLAALIREAMRRVVTEGTGAGASFDWISTGGKTGTAQKSRDGHGYTRGAYIASFTGIVPVEKPRLVILTILDEPTGYRHYAAQSAVPLFTAIVRQIRNSTDWLTDVPGNNSIPLPVSKNSRTIVVPDVQYLTVPKAAQILGAAGLSLRGAERDGVVVQQVPAAGTNCQPGQTVTLTVAGREHSAEEPRPLCPDFAGLSNRQVRGLAARLGIDVILQGTGYALTQSVEVGSQLTDKPVTINLEAQWN